MLARALPFVTQAAAAVPTPARSSGAPSPDSQNAHFARLLDQQASDRRDAERAEANRQANNKQTGAQAPQAAAPAAGTAPAPAPACASMPAPATAATSAKLPGKSETPRTARAAQADDPAADRATADSAAAKAPAAGGKPVVDGDGNSTGGGCLPGDDDAGDSTDAGDGTVCDAAPLAVTTGLPAESAAAAARAAGTPATPAMPKTPIKGGPGQEADDTGSTRPAGERSTRRGGPPGAAGEQGGGRDGRTGRLAAADADRQPADTQSTQPIKLGAGQEAASGNHAGTGQTLSRSFADELQALLPGTAAAAAAASATSATTAADAGLASAGAPADVPTEGRLHASPGTPEFAGALGAQLTTFVADGVHHARLELNPADMGPLTVQIQIDGQQAQVHLAAASADTRQALEQAMPQLAGSLREAGLTLSGGGVYDQPQQQPGQPSGDGMSREQRGGNHGGRGAGGNGIQPDTGMPPLPRSATAVTRRGVVDLVA